MEPGASRTSRVRQTGVAFILAVLKILFYVIIGAVIVIAGIAYFFMTWEPDRTEYPLRGIDVSHHNGEIDWGRVAGDDVAFAYIKATEGQDFSDPAFARNWKASGQAGVPHGAYHYFSYCSSGRDQALQFLSRLPRGETMLPPVLDLEMPTSETCELPGESDVRHEITSFVAEVERMIPGQVVLYVSEDFYTNYLKSAGVNRKLWVRSLWRSPSYARDWLVWQYQARGEVKGIETDVDLNVMAPDTVLSKLLIE